MSHDRTELEQEIVQALIESKAVDFDAAGTILAKYGARAALTGSEIVFATTRRFWLACGPIPGWDRGHQVLLNDAQD